MRIILVRRFILVAVAIVPLSGMGTEPASIWSIASGYFSSGSYCDAGKRGRRDEPGQQYTEETFERCARRDGRFKYVEKRGEEIQLVDWSDAKQYYRYQPYGRRYQEMPFDDSSLFDKYKDRSQIYPVFVFEMFSAESHRLTRETERAHYLRSFAVNDTLSTPQHTVFERSEELFNSANVKIVWRERLWILKANHAIVRFERLKNDDVLRFVEISSREIDLPLTDADLWYDAPLLARFSLSNNPAVFVAGLHVAAGLLGTIFWGWLFARADMIEVVLPKRRRLWRLLLWFFGGIAMVLAVLAAIVQGGSGHPPAIAYVWAMGIWCAVAFGMTACFLLASYPLDLLLRATRGRTSHGS
jgi:hypothetical protein